MLQAEPMRSFSLGDLIMGSLHVLLHANWDHEVPIEKALTATLSHRMGEGGC